MPTIGSPSTPNKRSVVTSGLVGGAVRLDLTRDRYFNRVFGPS